MMPIDDLFNLLMARYGISAHDARRLTLPQVLMHLGSGKRQIVQMPIGQYARWRREHGFD